MSRLDLIIFGATGFTGKHAIAEAVRLCRCTPFTWAVAGRNHVKIRDVLSEVSAKIGEDLSDTKVIIADVSVYSSLLFMCSQAKVVVNCCGPYRLYGELVVKACIAKKTHHVDISGEPEFIERMQLEYSEEARNAGVYIISACGFDSIPNDLGVVFLKQKFKGTVNSIESYLTSSRPKQYLFSPSLHYGTWESMVHGISNWGQLKILRGKLYPESMPKLQPKLAARSLIHKHENNWCLPFPGADGSVVYRTQRYFYESLKKRPIQFKAYLKLGSLFTVMIVMFLSIIIYAMCQFNLTRMLLLKYPRLFSMGMASHSGPSDAVMKSTKFRMTLYGSGWDKNVEDISAELPNKTMIVTVSGVNPGYGATVTMLLLSALTVLTESNLMPEGGGVLTTGAAFSKTNIIKKLNENNVIFHVKECSVRD